MNDRLYVVGCVLQREAELMSALPQCSASFAKDEVAKVFLGKDRLNRVPIDNENQVVYVLGCALQREDEVITALPDWSASFGKDEVAKVFEGKDRFNRVPMDNENQVVERLARQAASVLRHLVWEQRIRGDLIDWRSLRKCLADIVAAPESVDDGVAAEAVKLMENGVRQVGEGVWKDRVRKAQKDVEDVAILCCSRMKEVKKVEVKERLVAVSQDLASRLDDLFWQIFAAPQAKTPMLVRCLEGEAQWALNHVVGAQRVYGAVGHWTALRNCYESILLQPGSVALGVATRAVELVEAVKKDLVEAVKKELVEAVKKDLVELVEAVRMAQKHAQDLVVLCCGRDLDLGKKTAVEEALRFAFDGRDNANTFSGDLRGRLLNAYCQIYDRGTCPMDKQCCWDHRAPRTTRTDLKKDIRMCG